MLMLMMPGLKIEIPWLGQLRHLAATEPRRAFHGKHGPCLLSISQPSLPPPSTCLMVSRLRRGQPLAARHLLRRRGKSRRRRTCGPSRLTRDAWGRLLVRAWQNGWGTRKQDQRSTWNRSCHSVPRVRDSQCPQRPCHVLISRCLLGKPCAPAPWGRPLPRVSNGLG